MIRELYFSEEFWTFYNKQQDRVKHKFDYVISIIQTEEVITDTASEASVEYRLPERPEDDNALVNFFHQDKRLENLSDASEEDRLFAENQRLRVQIDRLKGIIYEVNNHDALFVLGDGCYSVVDFMNSLQVRLEKLMA